jgi:hypothetical protein
MLPDEYFKIESKNLVDKNFEGDFEHPNPNIAPFFERVKGYDYMTVIKVPEPFKF